MVRFLAFLTVAIVLFASCASDSHRSTPEPSTLEGTASARLTAGAPDDLPSSREVELQEALDAALLEQEALLRTLADRLEEIEHLDEALRAHRPTIEAEQEARQIAVDELTREQEIERERIRLEEVRRKREVELAARLAELERQRQEDLARLEEQDRLEDELERERIRLEDERRKQEADQAVFPDDSDPWVPIPLPDGRKQEADQAALRGQLEQLTNEIAAKDDLIDSYQAVINDYRCRFGLHTTRVPGGCPDPRPAEVFTIPIHHCMIDQTLALPDGELQRIVERANESITPFFARESSGLALIEFTAGSQHVVTVPTGLVTLASFANASTGGDCVNTVLNAHGGWDNYPDEPDSQLWTIHRLVLVRSTTVLDSRAGVAVRDSGPAFVVYRDEDMDYGDPFPLAVAAHELAHMLWGMTHVNESSCDHTSSLMDVGKGSACPWLFPQTQLNSLTIDCRNRQRAGWPC